jgi:hypothetical protein
VRYGWHDDHRSRDGTPEYLPAIQQVWEEFCGIAEEIGRRCLIGGTALQLGLGPCDTSHALWQAYFSHVVSIDYRACLVGFRPPLPGLDTGSSEALMLARGHAPYSFIFVDAGHSYEDVRRDHAAYGPLLRPGGLIAFHDALPRARYPEVEVWRYVKDLPGVRFVGHEVGVALL